MSASTSGADTAVLIIPALNEEPVIGATLAGIPPGLFVQVIVADNGSSDRTAAIARQAGATVTIEPRRGYGATCLAALRAVESAGIVVFMQADGSEDPCEAALLIEPVRRGEADLVLGSRVTGTAAKGALLPHQRFGNWVMTTLVYLLYGRRFTDLGPFRAIRRDALASLDMQDLDYGWTVEMQIKALRKGLRVIEVPVSYGLRQAGENKVSGNLANSLRAGAKMVSVVLRHALSRK